MVCLMNPLCQCVYHTDPRARTNDFNLSTHFVQTKRKSVVSRGNPYESAEAFEASERRGQDEEFEMAVAYMTRATSFIEDFLRRGRARAKYNPQPGEEPLRPFVIEFSRRILDACMSMCFPHIIGDEAFKVYKRQIMKMFNIPEPNRAVTVVMARGFGKSECMRAAAAMLVLCTTIRGTATDPYKILCLSVRKTPASLLMRNITETIKEMWPNYVESIEILRDNSEEKLFLINGTRYVSLRSVSCTEGGIRSNHVDIILVDEVFYTPTKVIQNALMPIIAEPGCRTMFASTPNKAGTEEDAFLREMIALYEEGRGRFKPVYLGMVCPRCTSLPPSEMKNCRGHFPYLQPWRTVDSFLPQVWFGTNEESILTEFMGQPGTRTGQCFLLEHLMNNRRSPAGDCDLNMAKEVIVSIDPTHNSGDEDGGSKFAMVSYMVTLDGRLCFLGLTNQYIGANGVQGSCREVERHFNALQETFAYFEECNFTVTIEGNNPAIAQELARCCVEYFKKLPNSIYFLRNNRGDPYMPATRFQRQQAVIAIEQILAYNLMYPYKRNPHNKHDRHELMGKEHWGTLFDQLAALEDDGKHISGKSAHTQDDLAMAFLNSIALCNLHGKPFLVDESVFDIRYRNNSNGRKRSRVF